MIKPPTIFLGHVWIFDSAYGANFRKPPCVISGYRDLPVANMAIFGGWSTE